MNVTATATPIDWTFEAYRISINPDFSQTTRDAAKELSDNGCSASDYHWLLEQVNLDKACPDCEGESEGRYWCEVCHSAPQ